MGISITWATDEQTILIVEYHDSYTWEDLRQVTDQMIAMIKSVIHPVDVITILNPRVKAPQEGNLMSHFSYILNHVPPNLRLYINVGSGNPFSAAVANIVIKLYRAPFEILNARNLKEAYQHIAKRSM